MIEKRPVRNGVNHNPQKRSVRNDSERNKTANGRQQSGGKRQPKQGAQKPNARPTQRRKPQNNGNVVSIKKKPNSKMKFIKAIPAFLLDEFMNAIPKFWSKFRKTVVFRVISIILLAFISVYFIGQIYRVYVIPVKTEVALEQTYHDNATAEFFAVRDEQLIHNSKSGRIVPLVRDGERVAKGDDIALIFADESHAADYTRMRELEAEIQYYETLSNISGANNVDIGHLNQQIQQEHACLAEAVDNRDIEAINEASQNLKDRMTRRQIATGQKADLSETLKSLKEEFEKLKSQNLNFSSVTAERSGYYISQTDGFESVLDYNNIDNVTSEQIESLLKGETEPRQKTDVVGKLADGFNWYLFCIVDNDTAAKAAVGKTLNIELPFSSVSDLKALTVNIKPTSDKQKSIITLKCSQMGAELASLRKEIGQIRFASYTGFKISQDVIHENENGERGVYVLQGRKVRFRKINEIYTCDDFVIANNITEDENGDIVKNTPGYIKLYDKIIVKGEDLSDGKII